ncbi:MAG: phenylacetate--CoA ligase [Clostridia bacterium]
MNNEQFAKLQCELARIFEYDEFYKEKFKQCGIEKSDIRTPSDLKKLPFTTKEELRAAYPLGHQAAPDEDIVRIHSSSGTTGKPIIIPYTQNDVDAWSDMFARCYSVAGVTKLDRIQITPGYGLWTAGIGFQSGAERLGAMTIPTGPGNTDKQIQMMIDMKSTVIAATSSYALLLAEEIRKRGVGDKIHLKKGIIGSERWGDKMRARIAKELGIELYDVYGLTEIYGPGISISCERNDGLHYWNDYLYFEVIDPETGENVPDGEQGELVITTLVKEGAPLIRYRTRDITHLINEPCPCGCKFPRHGRIVGRTDDMTKVKGVNIYPGQIDDLLREISGVSSEYQVVVEHINGKDCMLLRVECEDISDDIRKSVIRHFKTRVGILIDVETLPIGVLPRSEKKSVRILDKRY